MDPQALSATLIHHRYEILIPLSIIEGPIVALVTGALASRGYFNVLAVCGLFVAKDLIVDGAYFGLGRWSGRSHRVSALLPALRLDRAHIDRVREQWVLHGWRTILVGKLAWGLAPMVLASAGFVGVSPSAFFGYAVTVSAVQYTVLLALGFYVGSAIGVASLAMRVIGYAVAVLALVSIFVLRHKWRARSEEPVDGGGNLLGPVQQDDVIGIVDDHELGVRDAR
jgi:membrane protein DedA with SNARE-associated domain